MTTILPASTITMTGEPTSSGRLLLPQTTNMPSTISFQAPTSMPRENQKTYVFVNEQNRHKRLKVMRACEGCRRRKIKCDAATTNQWPCAACVRLKLNCVPPTVNYEKDGGGNMEMVFEIDPSADYVTSPSVSAPPNHLERSQSFDQSHVGGLQYASPTSSYMYEEEPGRLMSTGGYLDSPASYSAATYDGLMQHNLPVSQAAYQQSVMYAEHPIMPPKVSIPEAPWSAGSRESPTDFNSVLLTLGDLNINDTGVAPYIADHKRPGGPEVPVMDEPEIPLPKQRGNDLTVRIPAEMMPTEQEALSYFDTFFTEIHPYIPVIDRRYFYHQWHNERHRISPLILEGIFACASRFSDNPSISNMWLALAAKHEEYFKDVPRLSTLQGMLLILKGRESQPRMGYYYRSWLTLVHAISMAKDLGLSTHLKMHQLNKPCGSTPHDCIIKYRVWHSMFALELMIGGSQGRQEFNIDLDTIDYEHPSPYQRLDDPDHHIMRIMAAMNRAIRHTRITNQIAYQHKDADPNWMFHPDFLDHCQVYHDWSNQLPEALQLHIPEDGSTPLVTSHVIANLHAYYHLGILMHYRPILAHANYDNPNWKVWMTVAYSSAKKICQLQEAILDSFGMNGLAYMLRGVNVAIYAIISCIQIHLCAMTCPDPDFDNQSARELFTRHMRTLEQVTQHWSVPALQDAVDNCRQAFSADLNKPFELKANFPYGSPILPLQEPSPPLHEGNYQQPRPSFPAGQDPPNMHAAPAPTSFPSKHHPMTPPISACDTESKADSPTVQNIVSMANGHRSHPGSLSMANSAPHFNPSRIFEISALAFDASGTPPRSVPQRAHSYSSPRSSGAFRGSPPPQDPPLSAHSQTSFAHQLTSSPTLGHLGTHVAQSQPLPQAPSSYPSQAAFQQVTPSMWQSAVAASMETVGTKRAWHDDR